MTKLARTKEGHEDFQHLVTLLDQDLETRYAQDRSVREAHTTIDPAARVVVAYHGSEPVGCGCFRPTPESQTVEIKRMFVHPRWRGRGVAKTMLQELETWARTEGYTWAKLETGMKQPEAISLYQRSGYGRIENYEPYRNVPQSVCFGKELAS